MADARHRDSLAPAAGIDDTRSLLVDTMTETSGGRADQIMSEREDLGLAAICVVVVLLSIGGIVAAIVTGLLPGLAGLLLVLSCLMVAASFLRPLLGFA